MMQLSHCSQSTAGKEIEIQLPSEPKHFIFQLPILKYYLPNRHIIMIMITIMCNLVICTKFTFCIRYFLAQLAYFVSFYSLLASSLFKFIYFSVARSRLFLFLDPIVILHYFAHKLVNQNYNKILERDWLSAARFEH